MAQEGLAAALPDCNRVGAPANPGGAGAVFGGRGIPVTFGIILCFLLYPDKNTKLPCDDQTVLFFNLDKDTNKNIMH